MGDRVGGYVGMFIERVLKVDQNGMNCFTLKLLNS